MTTRFPQTTSAHPDDSAPETRGDERPPFVQALPLLLSVAATLALTLAFVAWTET